MTTALCKVYHGWLNLRYTAKFALSSLSYELERSIFKNEVVLNILRIMLLTAEVWGTLTHEL